MTRWAAVVTTLVVLAAAASCGEAEGVEPQSSATTPPRPQLLLNFDDQEAGSAEGRQIQGQGSAAITVAVLSLNKPGTVFEPGVEGMALRFPRYTGQETGSYGALRIEPEAWLSPGTSEFTFGADIKLDAVSNGSEVDNGDNVMQRGLFADPAQYKIQVDKHHASCVVRGAEGALTVKSKLKLTEAKWYRLTCHRLDKTVTLTVTEVGSSEPPAVVEKTGEIGPLDMTGSETFAIGAKIGADGDIVKSSTDQFNGAIDNVTYLKN